MTSTPVGMRCPDCARQRTEVRNPIAAPANSDTPATFALIGLCVLAFVGEMISGGDIASRAADSLSIDGGLFGPFVAEGEPYRIVTYSLLHAGIFHLGLNMFGLYVLGRLLEPAIGTARFLGIYFVSVLAGAFGALLLDPLDLTVGASGGIFGLMAAAFLIARHRGFDQLASQVGFFVVINVVFTFSVSAISVGGHIGGLIGGGLVALLINFAERRRTGSVPLEIAGIVALGVVVIVGALLAAEASLDDVFV
jgi:membrane associated rhomboid family serine protease